MCKIRFEIVSVSVIARRGTYGMVIKMKTVCTRLALGTLHARLDLLVNHMNMNYYIS